VGVVVKYVQQVGGRYVYRRAVPERLRDAFGKREIKIPLGKSQAEMMRKYGPAHAEVEKLLKQATASLSHHACTNSSPKSPFELFNEALDRISELGWKEDLAHADEIEIEHRDITAELELEKHPRNADGEYLNVPPAEAAYIRALRAREMPEPTLLDAKSVYIKDKITGKLDEKKDLQRLERAMRPLTEVAGENPPLAQITRRHAKKWLERFIDAGKTPANIKRHHSIIRAMFNYAALEFALDNFNNPFRSLELPKVHATKRDALPSEVITQVREHLAASGKSDLHNIWALTIWSGARIGEIAGMAADHVVLDHAVPHLILEPVEYRSVKTDASWRKVPLAGEALRVAQFALEEAKGQKGLFPRFAKKGGNTNVSNQLMKAVRLFTDDPKHVTHSLRHRLKDLLRLAEVSKDIQDMVLGHTNKSVGEGYGSERINLRLMRDALLKAHSVDVDSL